MEIGPGIICTLFYHSEIRSEFLNTLCLEIKIVLIMFVCLFVGIRNWDFTLNRKKNSIKLKSQSRDDDEDMIKSASQFPRSLEKQ